MYDLSRVHYICYTMHMQSTYCNSFAVPSEYLCNEIVCSTKLSPQEMYKLNNFHGMCDILGGLNDMAVYRLKMTKRNVAQKWMKVPASPKQKKKSCLLSCASVYLFSLWFLSAKFFLILALSLPECKLLLLLLLLLRLLLFFSFSPQGAGRVGELRIAVTQLGRVSA